MSLYEGAVKKPIMTSLCFLAVVIFGLFSLSKLPIDLYPDIDTNTPFFYLRCKVTKKDYSNQIILLFFASL